MSMMKARDFQERAVDATFAYLEMRQGNPVIVAPTGSGKSFMIATICRRTIEQFPAVKILIVQHVGELVEQNFKALRRDWPAAPAGIYSASLGKRNTRQSIIFASVQSIYRNPEKFGQVDLILIDEAHMVPKKGQGQYLKLLEKLRAKNPYIRVVGLTATPYRMDSGCLVEGKGDGIFTDFVYDIEVGFLIEQGWLSPLTTKATSTVLELGDVKTRGGEYITADLDSAVNLPEVTREICQEIVDRGEDRRSWLVFAVTVGHAEALAMELSHVHGVEAKVVSGETPKKDRRRLIEQFRTGELKALVSVGVLTTGFDAPNTDLLAVVRPTKSVGLYVQIMGRGMRPVYEPGFNPNGEGVTAEMRRNSIAAGPKPNCLVLDFGMNATRHGPVDYVSKPVKGGDGEPGLAPAKTCPECGEIVHAAKRECSGCGFKFPEPERKGTLTPGKAQVLRSGSVDAIEWEKVRDVTLHRHEKNGIASMRVEYLVDMDVVREWVCFDHSGYARQRAEVWWRRAAGTPVPMSTAEALQRVGEVRPISSIQRQRNGKFWEVKDVSFVPGFVSAAGGGGAAVKAGRESLDEPIDIGLESDIALANGNDDDLLDFDEPENGAFASAFSDDDIPF